MNNTVLLTKTYEDELTNHIRAILEQNDIDFKVVFGKNNMETTLGMQSSNPTEFYVYKDDLGNALNLIEGLNSSGEKEIDVEAFDDEEIKEIILNPEEWHDTIVRQAERIAKKRRLEISDNEIEENQILKLIEIQKGKSPAKTTFILMWVFAFMGGLIGLIAGLAYWISKQRAFDGKKYFVYDERTRSNGKLMFFISIFSMIIQFWLLNSFVLFYTL